MKAKAWSVESGAQRIFHKIFLVEFSSVTCNEGLKLIERKDFLQNVFGQVFCFLSPRWLAQLVCTGRGYNPLLSLTGNSKREIQFTWQRCALVSERNTMLRCAQMSVSWFDFSLHSSLSMALPDVYMIFGVIWGVANGEFYRVVFSAFLVALSSMFWRLLFSRLAENRLRATFCQSQYFEASPIPSNFHLASPHFTNPVRYLSAPV